MDENQIPAASSGSKLWIYILAGIVAIGLIAGGIFMFSEKGTNGETAGIGDGAGTETSSITPSGGASELSSLQCEDVVSQDFLESTFSKDIANYSRYEIINAVGKLVVNCNYETASSSEGIGADGFGGTIIIAEGSSANYENTLNNLQSQYPGAVTVSNDVTPSSFNLLVVSKMPIGPDLKQVQYHFITSDNTYWIIIMVITHDGTDPTPYAKTIAQEVNSNL